MPRTHAQEAIDFRRDIRPILERSCTSCHGSGRQSSSYRLDRRDIAFQGGEFEQAAIVPGKSTDSPLYQYIAGLDPKIAMPPKDSDAPPLTPEEMERVRRWIDAGAEWPNDEEAVDQRLQHWSYQPLSRAFHLGSIDAFVDEKLREHGLNRSPSTDASTFCRRAHFDLIGLPPTPERVERFTAEWGRSQDQAVASLVDELLASPHFGERWARHWLDVVRFAESDGFETNQPRPNAWPYRDYVIRAINEDKPYDQFVREQLAGDQLGVDEATGFLVGGPWDKVKSPDPVLTANQRADELHDMVGTTAATFLGLTVSCARCHSHKFDPISQVDYYRMKACLAGVQHGERVIRPKDYVEREAASVAARQKLESINHRLTQLQPLASMKRPESNQAGSAASNLRDPVTSRENIDRFEPTEATFVRFNILATNGAEPCIDELEVFTSDGRNVASHAKLKSSGDYAGNPIHQLPHINDGKYGNEHSWISNTVGRGWVELELSEPAIIDRVLWSRDRSPTPRYSDRTATEYTIDVSMDGREWRTVANDWDRIPQSAGTSTPPVASSTFGLTTKELAELQELQDAKKKLTAELAVVENAPRVYAGMMGTPEATPRFHRGDPTQPRELVAPGALESFNGFELTENASDAERRLALATWISSEKNPLTARVMVNRIWHYHFGVGIVDTPSDFGFNGGRPTHPELLDWLATQLIQNGWRLKSIHRLICNSQVYRQTSLERDEAHNADSSNRLLWRFPTRRLEAESLRDAILAVSGKLDKRSGGPGFDLFETNTNYVKVYKTKTTFASDDFRRMIYQNKPRVELDNLFGAFDCPDAGQIQPRRNVSTTPLQALNLLNSSFMLEQANAFADRLQHSAPNDESLQLDLAYRLSFGRAPLDEEKADSLELLRANGLPAVCRVLFNTNEFVTVH